MDRMLCACAAALVIAGVESPRVSAQPRPEVVYEGKPLSEWLKLLKSGEGKERERAAEAIGAIVTQARPGLAALPAALGDEAMTVRGAAYRALTSPAAPAAVPALTAALWGENAEVRLIAIETLGKIGPPARPAVPSLVHFLKTGGPATRRSAAVALAAIGAREEAIPALTDFLKDPDPAVRRSAAATLVRVGAPAATVLPVLTEFLGSEEPKMRGIAAELLVQLGREARPAVPALILALQNRNAEVRRAAAAEALGRIGPGAKEALPVLADILKRERDAGVRLTVAEALWRIGRHPDVVPALKGWVKDESWEPAASAARLLWRVDRSREAVAVLGDVMSGARRPRGNFVGSVIEWRLMAAEPLREVGPNPASAAAVDGVAAALQFPGFPDMRAAAAEVLGRFGEHARPAVPQLKALLRDEDTGVRLNAAVALWRIDKDRTVLPMIADLLKDKRPWIRLAAARALGQIGPPAKEAAPALAAALHDETGQVRTAAAESAWRVGKDPAALPVLIAALRDRDADVRGQAAAEIGYLYRADGKPAVPALVQALWDEDSGVRSAAAEALGRIGPAAAEAVPPLTVVLGSPGEEDNVYSAAAEALGLIGPAAKAAVPVLRERLRHPDAYVRVNAAQALSQLDRSRDGLATATAGLDDRSDRVRAYAAETLWMIDRDARSVPILIESLGEAGSDAANLRYVAARALGRIGPPAKSAVPALREAAHDVDPLVGETAAEALRLIR